MLAISRGWFFIDLLSILPYQIIGDISGQASLSNLKMLKIIRLLRLIKLARVLRASRLWKRFELKTTINYSALALMKYLIFVLVCIHWVRPHPTIPTTTTTTTTTK